MISEVANALFLTYLASEYLVDDVNVARRSNGRSSSSTMTIGVLFVVVILVNIVDRITGAVDVVNRLLDGFFHLPRITFAAVFYVIALYVDVTRQQRKHQQQQQMLDPSSSTSKVNIITWKSFLSKVGVAFCQVLPAYPFLAVLISFVFLFVINLWEALHLPLEWLNAPIYYGTLYGPFAWVYVHVKHRILDDEKHRLPS